MKVTKQQLKEIIKEYKELLRPGHVDGQPWSGTLEDLATVQSKTWGHGEVVTWRSGNMEKSLHGWLTAIVTNRHHD